MALRSSFRTCSSSACHVSDECALSCLRTLALAMLRPTQNFGSVLS